MATATFFFDMLAAYPVNGATTPEFQGIAASNNTEPVYLFDAGGTETIGFRFRVPDYASSLAVDFHWYSNGSQTSGDVVLEGKIMAYTMNSDTQDFETDAWATAQTVTDSHLGTTAQQVMTAPLSITNTDSIAAGDHVRLAVSRLGGNGSDTMTGDMALVGITVTYTTT